MNVQELALVAENFTFEQRKELIKALFAQLPKAESLAGSVVWIGDLEAGSQEIREQANASIERSAQVLRADEAEPEPNVDVRH